MQYFRWVRDFSTLIVIVFVFFLTGLSQSQLVVADEIETLFRGKKQYNYNLRNYGVFGGFYGYEGRLRPHSSVFDTLRNTDVGMQFGISLPTKSMFSTSLYYSYSNPTHTVLSSLSSPLWEDSNLSTTNHLFGLRWSSDAEGLFMQFGLNGGFDKYQFQSMHMGNSNGSGWQMGANGEVGLDVEASETWKLRPYLGLDYRWLQQDDISIFRDSSYDALYSDTGMRIFHPFGPLLDWQTRFSWLHNGLSSSHPIYVPRFGSVPGTSTATQLYLDGNIGRDWFWFGTGLNLHYKKFFNAYVDYDLTFNKYTASHTGSLAVVMMW